MLIFGAYKGQRLTLDVPVGMTVHELKEIIQERLGISVDAYRRDNKVMVLSYAGADLGDTWVFTDLGILPGTTIKIQLKENVKPVLYIRCSHNQETISVYDDMAITSQRLHQIRSLASMMSGLPVGIFRLTTVDGREMFDSHCLEDYNVDVGHTIFLETWDGWNEFLNLAIMGFTQQVLSQVGGEEVVARYQMKVALFIASHFGHIDLARCILKQGIRSDEPTAYHPARMWCKENGHIDSLKCPVHEATLCGQVGVLRLFVNHDITCLKAKDGNGLEPLNIALRQKVKECASFLLSKQWTKVNINKHFALHVGTYTHLRKWCERAKECALLKYGPAKSTLKRRNFNSGPLISHGVVIDGFSKSPMTGKSKTELMKVDRYNRETEMRQQRYTVPVAELLGSTDDPEHYFTAIVAAQGAKFRQRPGRYPLRWQKSSLSSKSLKGEALAREMAYIKTSWKVRSHFEGSTSGSSKLRTPSLYTLDSDTVEDDGAKLPTVMQSMLLRRKSKSMNDLGLGEAKMTINTQSTKARLNKENSKITGLTIYKDAFSQPPSVHQSSVSRENLKLAKGATTRSLFNQFPFSEHIQRSKRGTEVSRSVISDRSAMIMKNPVTHQENLHLPKTNVVVLENNKCGNFKKRKGHFSNVFLSSNVIPNKGSVTLPTISHEQDRLPFFYYHGQRENELIDSTLEPIAKFTGSTSRERAIKSLTLANSFSEKPWLCRVRLALNVTSNSLKRNAKKFREIKQKLVLN